jgi:hypothetical protein
MAVARGVRRRLSQHQRTQFFGDVPTLNPRPHGISQELLLRLLNLHLDELRKVEEECRASLAAAVRAHIPLALPRRGHILPLAQ